MKPNGLEMNTMSDNFWEWHIRSTDIGDMDEEKKAEFINLLNQVVLDVCWKYGVHN
jgi:hypothetical protein